jgi:23S rRNA pseudouridine1911/1915/1917 synthase
MGDGEERLDRRVARQAGCSRAVAAELVAGGKVRVDGEVERRPAVRVAEAEVVEVDDVPEAPGPLQPDPSVEVPLVHEDADVLVVDKPAGLVVHPGAGGEAGTLVHGLLARFPEVAGVGPDPDRPGIVHRLDRGTSGLVVVARTPAGHAGLTDQIARHEVERVYAALVWGTVAEATGRVEAPIGRSPRRPTLRAVVPDGRPAATDYEVESRHQRPEPTTLLRCRLETGRTHQIRVHLAAIDHPVVGDGAYGGGRPSIPLERPFLHATHLSFTHPTTGVPLSFDSPLPDDLNAVLSTLSPL